MQDMNCEIVSALCNNDTAVAVSSFLLGWLFFNVTGLLSNGAQLLGQGQQLAAAEVEDGDGADMPVSCGAGWVH